MPSIGSGGEDEVQPGGDDDEVQPGGDEDEVFSRSPVVKAKYPCAARVPSLRGIQLCKVNSSASQDNRIGGEVEVQPGGDGDEVRPGGDEDEVQPGGDEDEVFSRSPVVKTKYPRAARVPSLQTQFDPICLDTKGVAILVFRC